MVTQTEDTVAAFVSDGAQTTYTFNFTVPQNDQSLVLVRQRLRSNLSAVTLTLNTDYTIDFVEDTKGGNVVLVAPLPADDILEVWRDGEWNQQLSDTTLYSEGLREDGDDKSSNLVMNNRDRILYFDELFSTVLGDLLGGGGGEDEDLDLINPVANRLVKVVNSTTIESSSILEEVSGIFKILKDSLVFSGEREVTTRLNTAVGTFNKLTTEIDEAVLTNDTVLSCIPDPSEPDGVKLTPAQIVVSGGVTLTNPIVDRLTKVVTADEITSTARFEESNDQAVVIGDTLYFRDNPETRRAGAKLDLTTGTWDTITTSIDEALLVGGEVLAVTFAGGELTLSPVVQNSSVPPPTGTDTYIESQGGAWVEVDIVAKRPEAADDGRILEANDDGTTSWVDKDEIVTITNPLQGRYAIIRGDNELESGDMLDGLIGGEKTTYSTKIGANTFVLHTAPGSFCELKMVATETPYKARLDIAPEKTTDGQYLQLVKDTYTEYRIVSADPVEVPDTELYHVDVGGGAVNNVVTFLGHQEVDVEKFVEDSALTNGAANWGGLDLTVIEYRRLSAASTSATIASGAVTLDLSLAKTFYTSFSENITSLTITNAQTGSSFLWLLENVGGFGFTIDFNNDIYWEDGFEYQSTGLEGEADGLLFLNRGTFWQVTHVLETIAVTLGDVLIINGSVLGNIVTASGSGTVVEATGDVAFVDGTLSGATLKNIEYRRVSYSSTAEVIVGGVIAIDVVNTGRFYTVSVDANVTALDVADNFDRAKNANFCVFFNETADGFTYNFGTNFLFEGGSLPEVSISGQFKYYVLNWLPALQAWYAFRQQ